MRKHERPTETPCCHRLASSNGFVILLLGTLCFANRLSAFEWLLSLARCAAARCCRRVMREWTAQVNLAACSTATFICVCTGVDSLALYGPISAGAVEGLRRSCLSYGHRLFRSAGWLFRAFALKQGGTRGRGVAQSLRRKGSLVSRKGSAGLVLSDCALAKVGMGAVSNKKWRIESEGSANDSKRGPQIATGERHSLVANVCAVVHVRSSLKWAHNLYTVRLSSTHCL